MPLVKPQSLDTGSVITVAQLKSLIKDWPEMNLDGEPAEVWMVTGKNLSSPVFAVSPLNARDGGCRYAADIIFEPVDGFWVKGTENATG